MLGDFIPRARLEARDDVGLLHAGLGAGLEALVIEHQDDPDACDDVFRSPIVLRGELVSVRWPLVGLADVPRHVAPMLPGVAACVLDGVTAPYMALF